MIEEGDDIAPASLHAAIAHPAAKTQDDALIDLLRQLRAIDYHFVTPTPDTHGRVLARADKQYARTLRDIFGWGLSFDRHMVDPSIFAALQRADAIACRDQRLYSRVRVSSLNDDLFLHSSYPTTDKDAVFFGPDSYRFADLIHHELDGARKDRAAHIVDIGTGTGVGAIVAARAWPGARLTMTDINAKALHLATLNAAAAGVQARAVLGSDLSDVADPIDVAIANPPYIIDQDGRNYRDGGAMHGGAVSLDMARMALARLAPGGKLILYTGSAIVEGRDSLKEALFQCADHAGCTMHYREIDPDVFGEELSCPAYKDVERIAVVAAVAERP